VTDREHGLDATANEATRDRRQELGRGCILALHSIARNARVHDEQNAVFAVAVGQLQKAIAELLLTDSSFDLRLADDGLFVNRQHVRLDANSAALFAFLKAAMMSRGIHGLRATETPDSVELRELVRLLSPGAPSGLTEKGDRSRPLRALTLAVHRSGAEDTHVRAHDTRLVDSYSHAVFFVDRTIAQLRAGAQSVPVWAASRVVQDLVELRRETPLRFLQLARTRAGGAAYWGYHAANVAVLAIAFGARLGMVKRRQHDLGMAGLFHDVGLAVVPAELLQRETALSEAEIASIRGAPLFSARTILRQREVYPAALARAQAVYECHFGPDTGAPGRILAICEAYDALTTTRPQRRAYGHFDALRILTTELSERLDPRLVELFPAVVESFS
jgi:hypothetical protein